MLSPVPPLFDIAVNLHSSQFDRDRDDVVARAVGAGVERMLVLGTSLAESETALALARAHPGRLFATAGVHPHDAKGWNDETEAGLRELLRAPEVLAVGECGLDFDRNFSEPDVQRRVLVAQVELAAELHLPLVLHEREAADALLEIVCPVRDRLGPVVVHCFTADGSTLDRYLDHDFHIGITGWICDERRGSHLHPLVGRIPPGRLMLETDAPYLLPRSLHRDGTVAKKSRRNEPMYLPAVAAEVARHTGESEDALAARTWATTLAFLGLRD
ncbi:TatD family hydrolase [Engelhardtia mirabilis]|uniref:Tat-linked quality control protein TatD n=1 Tax=Engelhardtia mirabilis TaxID=2528011 RepID=A0A518BHD3_9BACT|nr:Tat-linked quality control protein TatD [Planctomycetes bacterium Pla133]QDV00717.1 Tat-linked quality control protein TatD [Planctomycetes bacterium Pla86]